MAGTETIQKPLEYEPAIVAWSTRRRIRVLMIIALSLVLVLVISPVEPAVVHKLKLLSRQRLWGAYQGAVGQVIWREAAPGESQIGSQFFWRNVDIAFVPPARKTLGEPCYGGTVFLHRLQSHSGHERIVCVDVAPKNWLSFDAFVIEPATLFGPMRFTPHEGTLVVRFELEFKPGSTIFAAQLDASDPSHFTFDYRIGEGTGTVDGWLGDDDQVRLVPRTGSVSGNVWRP